MSSQAFSFQSPFLSTPPNNATTPASTTTTTTTTALIVLNSPIPSESSSSSPVFEFLWSKSSFKVCADGGANRLRSYSKSKAAENGQDAWIPHLIVGDLDSLESDVRDYYSRKNVELRKIHCQDTNDLDKALQACCSHFENDRDNNNITTTTTIYVYGAFGGRFDQEMASFQALYKFASPKMKIILYCEDTFAFLIPGGQVECTIQLNLPPPPTESTTNNGNAAIYEGPTCGLIPLGGPCTSVTTTGFQWNLNNQSTEFGGLVSTSNRILRDEVVKVQSSHPIIFTSEIQGGLSQSASSS